MKQIFTILLTIFYSTVMLSQGVEKEIEYLGYIPMRTHHFMRSERVMNSMDKTEGGNLGLIVIRRKNQSKKVFTEKHLGLVKNSYGAPSLVLNQGFGYRAGNINLGMALGIATGYEKCFAVTHAEFVQQLPGVFSNNGILPVTIFNISLERGIKIGGKVNVSPLLNISPAFLNGGLIVKIL